MELFVLVLLYKLYALPTFKLRKIRDHITECRRRYIASTPDASRSLNGVSPL